MLIANDIAQQISTFSSQNKHDDIVNYLKKQLKLGKTNANEIFDYANRYQFKKEPKPYVINAATINKLGVVISNLEDKAQKKLCVDFYKLAAERGSSWGNRNCAEYFLNGKKAYGFERAPELALTYAEKAVKLAKADNESKHEHKYIYGKVLWANQRRQEAIIALLDFTEYKLNKRLTLVKPQEKEKLTEELNEAKQAIDSCQESLSIMQAEFLNENGELWTSEGAQARLLILESFFKINTWYNPTAEALALKSQAYYIKAKCHEALGESSQAMLDYCQITDKKLPFYSIVIEARARLIKNQIASSCSESVLTTFDNSFQTSSQLDNAEEPINFILPNKLTLPARFGANWKAEATWFHSVDEIGVKAEFEKRLTQIERFIAAKETEIELVKETLENKVDDKELLDRKKLLEEGLASLEQTKLALEEKYKKHLQDYRQTFRRHEAEVRFFNPKRTNKREQLVELANQIIEQRYNHSKATLQLIKLTDKSTRLVITVEKAFQESIMALTGKNNPKLGIPIAREKPWSTNYSSGTTTYGPIECYQVGETEIQAEHRAEPKRQRLGDSFLPQHGTYNGDIYPFLSRLAEGNVEKEKQLTCYMLRYGKNHQPISLEELQVIYTPAEQDDVDHFNRICFLIMEKEQMQWHSTTNERYQLGMIVAQARCLIMLEAGYISFEEAFKNNTLFGIYSNTGIIDNPEKVAKSCQNIDNFYIAYLQTLRSSDYLIFFKKHIRSSAKPKCVLTREQAHQDLSYVYGGDSDTDDEGYGSDLSM